MLKMNIIEAKVGLQPHGWDVETYLGFLAKIQELYSIRLGNEQK